MTDIVIPPRKKRNNRIRAALLQKIVAIPINTKILTKEMVREIDNRNRPVSSSTLGHLIRELSPEYVQQVSHGVWVRVGEVPA